MIRNQDDGVLWGEGEESHDDRAQIDFCRTGNVQFLWSGWWLHGCVHFAMCL